MSSSTEGPTVVRVSQKGQATIPKDLRERFGIDAPGEVFIYEEAGRIVVEPVPSLDDLHGIHAGDHAPGDVMERVGELRDRDAEREEEETAQILDRYGTGEDA